MKCDEVQTLQGAYIDSELDARTTLDVQQHLAACPACARAFAEEQKLEARITAGLKQGRRTEVLWARIEGELAGRDVRRTSMSASSGWFAALGTLGARFQASWQTARWAWAGLAAAWVVILALDLSAREPQALRMAGNQLPPAADVRFAVKQRELLMADLVVLSEPAPAAKTEPVRPSPRSERPEGNLNV